MHGYVANRIQSGLQILSRVEQRRQLGRRRVPGPARALSAACSGRGVAVGVAAHAQQLGQPVQEDPAHPGGHAVVRGGGAVVDVDGKDGDDDGERDEDHGEHQVLPDEGDGLGGGGDDLLDDQEEDGERHQDRGAEGDLLAAVGGQVEDEDGEEGQADAGDDEEEGVEKGEPADDEEVGDGGVGGAAVRPQAPAAGGFDDLPFAVVEIVALVDMEVLQNDIDLVKKKEEERSYMFSFSLVCLVYFKTCSKKRVKMRR